jgi:hypothetical protein
MMRVAVRAVLYVVFLSIAIAGPVSAQSQEQDTYGPVSAQPQEQDTYTVRKKPKPDPQEQQQTQPQQRPQQQTTQSPPQQTPQPQQTQRPQTQPSPQQQTQRPQQAMPADVAERVLTRRLGSEGLQQALRQMETMSVEAGTGRGAPMADRWFDGARTRIRNDDAVRPGGTPFFRGSPSPPQTSAQPQGAAAAPAPVTSGGYQRATVQDAKGTTGRYGSIPGGIVLEGIATGLGSIRKVRYDRRFNALILDDRAVYFMTVPPRTVALLSRAIAQDDRVGVSLGDVHIVYGAVPPDSELAMDLKAADRFLGDIVFAQQDWTVGYRFANGYQPQPNRGERFRVAVFFNLNAFQFQVQNEEVRLTRSGFDVRLLPLSDSVSAQGGHLPDLDAISRGRVSAQYEANAQHVAEHISYYRRERIVDRMFAYGEVAAVIRALKQAGVDLHSLARSIH